MRGHMGVAIIGLAAGVLLASCGGSDTIPQAELPADAISPANGNGMPPLADLDSIKSSAVVTDYGIDVTQPIAEQHTQVAGESLEFIPPADELAYALYRIDPPGPPLTLSATGAGPLWLLVADYGAGKWMMEPFADGYAEINLDLISDLYSPDGYMYGAVVCPAGEQGRLDSMTLAYDQPFWELNIWADEDSITLEWNELDFDNYIVCRSTLADDQAPYEVASRFEAHSGKNRVVEQVPQSGSNDRWVPENNENSTSWDRSDDFPEIAPEVDYHYRVIPVLDGHRYTPSPEVSTRVVWGSRRSTRRIWPDTTNQSRFYGHWMDGARMTDAQLEWCAQNMVGATGFLQSELDVIRNINPDFIALGAHFAMLSSPTYQNVTTYRHNSLGGWVPYLAQFYGDERDIDGAYPYIDRHEDWFIHDPTSVKYQLRVTNGWDEDDGSPLCYFMDLDGRWPEYLDTNLRQLLGEDCYDGWQLDGAHANWGVTPPFYQGLGYERFYDYLLPRLTATLNAAGDGAAGHPLEPYIFAQVHRGWGSYMLPPPIEIASCDGIIVGHFIDANYSDMSVRISEFTEVAADLVIECQNAGKPVILHGINRRYYEEFPGMLEYCCYLLLRGPQSYFYATPASYYSDAYGSPHWHPAYSWESGAPLAGEVASLADITDETSGSSWFYRREFENGFVVVMPYDMEYYVFDDKFYEYLECTGGGPVAEDGSVPGTAVWKPINDLGLPGYAMWGPGAWIMREVQD